MLSRPPPTTLPGLAGPSGSGHLGDGHGVGVKVRDLIESPEVVKVPLGLGTRTTGLDQALRDSSMTQSWSILATSSRIEFLRASGTR